MTPENNPNFALTQSELKCMSWHDIADWVFTTEEQQQLLGYPLYDGHRWSDRFIIDRLKSALQLQQDRWPLYQYYRPSTSPRSQTTSWSWSCESAIQMAEWKCHDPVNRYNVDMYREAGQFTRLIPCELSDEDYDTDESSSYTPVRLMPYFGAHEPFNPAHARPWWDIFPPRDNDQ